MNLQKWPFDQIKNKAFNFDKEDFRSQGEIIRLPGGTCLKASVLKTDIIGKEVKLTRALKVVLKTNNTKLRFSKMIGRCIKFSDMF